MSAALLSAAFASALPASVTTPIHMAAFQHPPAIVRQLEHPRYTQQDVVEAVGIMDRHADSIVAAVDNGIRSFRAENASVLFTLSILETNRWSFDLRPTIGFLEERISNDLPEITRVNLLFKTTTRAAHRDKLPEARAFRRIQEKVEEAGRAWISELRTALVQRREAIARIGSSDNNPLLVAIATYTDRLMKAHKLTKLPAPKILIAGSDLVPQLTIFLPQKTLDDFESVLNVEDDIHEAVRLVHPEAIGVLALSYELDRDET